jgi:hypothetical protein
MNWLLLNIVLLDRFCQRRIWAACQAVADLQQYCEACSGGCSARLKGPMVASPPSAAAGRTGEGVTVGPDLDASLWVRTVSPRIAAICALAMPQAGRYRECRWQLA